MLKKYLLLIIVFLFSITLVFWLFQEEVEKANFLANNGIIKDNSNNPDDYRLWDNITRKETMKIVMKLSWLDIEDKCEWKFDDVINDWGCKYIEAGLKAWFIASNINFRPNDNITKTESMKLVLKARWIEKTIETEKWQEDYMKTAYEYWIIDEEYYDFDSKALRWWIFKIAVETIEKEKEIKEKQDKIYSDEVTL
jgi:hypothetical protein